MTTGNRSNDQPTDDAFSALRAAMNREHRIINTVAAMAAALVLATCLLWISEVYRENKCLARCMPMLPVVEHGLCWCSKTTELAAELQKGQP